jgi:urea transporter
MNGQGQLRVFGIGVLPPVQEGTSFPFWRRALRGFSQCAFQENEVTAVLLILAVAVYNWEMALFYGISVVLATIVAQLLHAAPDTLNKGLYGFNAGLMGLALGNFYVHNTALWFAVPIIAIVVAALNVAAARWLPFPALAAPFLATFWILWPIAGSLDLHKISLGAFPTVRIHDITAIFATAGSTVFAPTILAGAIVLAALLVANWRCAVIAAGAALIAVIFAQHSLIGGGEINSGFVGFNAVLAALATYTLVAKDLRLIILAAIVATWIFTFIAKNAAFPALASGLVFTIWGIMLAGWINPRFFAKP